MLLSTAVAAAALLASSACAQAPIEEGSGMSAGEKYAARKAHREAARALQERSPDFVEDLQDFGSGVASVAGVAGSAVWHVGTSVAVDGFEIGTSVGAEAWTFGTSVGAEAYTMATSAGAVAYTAATSVGQEAYTWATSAVPKAAKTATAVAGSAWGEGTSLGAEGYAMATSVVEAEAAAESGSPDADVDNVLAATSAATSHAQRSWVAVAAGAAVLGSLLL